MWEKKASRDTSPQWLVDLKTAHGTLPEELVTITVADIQQRVSYMNAILEGT